MFGTFLEKTQALLSRSFLFGAFFPTLAFVVVNAGLGLVAFPAFKDAVVSALPPDATKLTMSLVAALTAVAILGFMLAPMIPIFRRTLEGEYLPQRVRRRLILAERRRFLALQSAYTRSGAWWSEMQHIAKTSLYVLGEARGYAGPNVIHLPAAIADARFAKRALDARLLGGRTSTAADRNAIHEAVGKLEAAFRSLWNGHGPVDAASLAELDGLQTELLALLDEQVRHTYSDFQLNESAVRSDFADPDFKPTLLANRRAASERYPRDAYHADFDFIWPRLRLVLLKDKELNDLVDTAQGQLDFAILGAALSAATTVVWLPLSAISGESFPAYLGVATLGPIATWFFYQLTIATQDAFGAVLSTAVDAMRFDLLTALHRPLPASLDAERKGWEELQLALYAGPGEAIRYKHKQP